MREAFEAWAKLRHYSLICEDDEYLLRETKIAWSAWQAAAKWEREECAKVAEEKFDFCGNELLIAEAIRARSG